MTPVFDLIGEIFKPFFGSRKASENNEKRRAEKQKKGKRRHEKESDKG